jgi:hypothetical protein
MAVLPPFIFDDYYQVTNPPVPGTPDPAPAPVTMDFILGSLGQSATYTAILDGKSIYTHEHVSHKNIPLGDTAILANKVLSIVGNIVNIPGTDNNLTLDFTVNGGMSRLVKSYFVQGTAGDIVNFSIIIRFY